MTSSPQSKASRRRKLLQGVDFSPPTQSLSIAGTTPENHGQVTGPSSNLFDSKLVTPDLKLGLGKYEYKVELIPEYSITMGTVCGLTGVSCSYVVTIFKSMDEARLAAREVAFELANTVPGDLIEKSNDKVKAEWLVRLLQTEPAMCETEDLLNCIPAHKLLSSTHQPHMNIVWMTKDLTRALGWSSMGKPILYVQ